MNRRKFIQDCGKACLSVGIGASLISCGTSMLPLSHIDNQLLVDVSSVKPGVIYTLRPKDLSFPVAIFKKEDGTFNCFLMRCSHQGSLVQAFGDRMVCTAHGSAFDKNGAVLNGPASSGLRPFKTSLKDQTLTIELS